jgi:thioredoxin-like negative regulator of GroEL
MAQYKKFSEMPMTENNPLPSQDTSSVIIKNLKEKMDIVRGTDVVVIYVFADWCEPCKIVGPEFSKMAMYYNQNFNGKVFLCKENVDMNLSPDCTAVPMFSFFKQGKKVDEFLGGELSNVVEKIRKLLDQ